MEKSKKQSTPEQVAVLERLSQQAGAWMIGCTARALRDWVDAPRNRDGTYNGRDLVAWARDRLQRPELSEDDLERLLVVRDVFSESCADTGEALNAIEALRDLRTDYGESAWLVFVDMLINELGYTFERYRSGAFRAPSEETIRQEIEQRLAQERERAVRRMLHVSIVCEECGKLRRGRRWIDADPPDGWAVVRGICPGCRDSG